MVLALMLLLSVENTFNRIWQVKKSRPVLRRLVRYLASLLIGPVAIGSSLWAAAWLLATAGELAGARAAWLIHVLKFGPPARIAPRLSFVNLCVEKSL